MSKSLYLYGKNPLHEAILAVKRGKKGLIKRLLLTKQALDTGTNMSLIQSNNLPYAVVTGPEIERLVGRESVHQGVCAEIDESLLYTSLDTILDAQKPDTRSLLVLLDELEDPHNVGAIIRSAAAFGASAVLISEHGQASMSGTILKASAGMIFHIPIVRIGNVNTTLTKLKEKGFWIYALTGEGDTLLTKTTFDSSSVIVIGSEGSGVRPHTLSISDFRLAIPISKQTESLNASNALAITLYEWRRQNS